MALSGGCPVPGSPCSENPCKLKGFGGLQGLGVRGHMYIQTLCVPRNGIPGTSLGRGKVVLGLCAHNLHLLLTMDPHIHRVLSGHFFLEYIKDHLSL